MKTNIDIFIQRFNLTLYKIKSIFSISNKLNQLENKSWFQGVIFYLFSLPPPPRPNKKPFKKALKLYKTKLKNSIILKRNNFINIECFHLYNFRKRDIL